MVDYAKTLDMKDPDTQKIVKQRTSQKEKKIMQKPWSSKAWGSFQELKQTVSESKWMNIGKRARDVFRGLDRIRACIDF